MSDESNETTSDDEPKGAYFDAPGDDAEPGEEPAAEAADEASEEAGDDAADQAGDAEPEEEVDPAVAAEKAARAERKAKADAAIAERRAKDAAVAAASERNVTRRTVTSRRVTPKAGAPVEPTSGSKARDAKKTESVVTRTAPVVPQQVYSKGPSPWYVPAIMFGLLIIGALVIMSNYMGVFGDASNIRLVIGLGFILGGIVTATQYR